MHPLSWGPPRPEGWGSVKQWEVRCWDPRGALWEITSFLCAGLAQHPPEPWSPSSPPPARLPACCPLHPPMAAGGSDPHGPHPCSMTDPWRSDGQRGPPRDSDSTWGHLTQDLGQQEAQADPETTGGAVPPGPASPPLPSLHPR